MNIITMVVSYIICIIISSYIAIWLVRKNTVSKKSFESVLSEKTAIENKLDEERCTYDRFMNERETEINGLRNDLQITRDKASVLDHIKNENLELKNKNESISNNFNVAREKISALETEKQILNEQRALQIKQLQEMQDNLKIQFENIGNKIFTDHSKTFKQESQSNLTALLSPLKSDIEGFKKKIDESFEKQSREQFSLKTEIANIVKINEEMTSQTSNLTKALKGDFRMQGNWGEVILERILEESGLRPGQDYILQGSDMGMKHPDTGQNLKPDVIVKLPEDKHIIIDSKVSLTDYERYCSESDEQIKTENLKQFLVSVKRHVNDLQDRRYQDSEKLKTPDFVLMFMPIEGAFTLAIQSDPELHSTAWNKKVIIVCPSTLFATLRTISSIWRLELQNKNTMEIARVGGTLYDKVFGFIEDMEKIGKSISASQNAYDNSIKKLRDGRGSVISQTEKLKSLGAKASKNLCDTFPNMVNDDSLESDQIFNINESVSIEKNQAHFE